MKKIFLIALVGLFSLSFGTDDVEGSRCKECNIKSACKTLEECEMSEKKFMECMRNCK